MRASIPLVLLLLAGPAAAAREPVGELLLDAADPVIAARIDDMPVRLRVDLSQDGTLEISAALAARLSGPFEPGNDIEVGRTLLRGRVASARLRLDGKPTPLTVSTHHGARLGEVDGVIGPEQLPYAIIRWRRADAPAPDRAVALPIAVSDATRLSAEAPELPGLRLRFAPAEASSATAAGGALLAASWGGTIDPARLRIPLLFGIERPARLMRFARPGTLAGFRLTTLPVRAFDFAGEAPPLVAAPVAQPGEVLVSHPLPPQREWRAVTLGGDLLSRCAEIAYDRSRRMLTLHCAFGATR